MDYSFTKDLLDTFQSMSDGLKVLLIVVTPLFLICFLGLILFYKFMCLKVRLTSVDHGRSVSSPDD